MKAFAAAYIALPEEPKNDAAEEKKAEEIQRPGCRQHVQIPGAGDFWRS
jgi:hypothetical protein